MLQIDAKELGVAVACGYEVDVEQQSDRGETLSVNPETHRKWVEWQVNRWTHSARKRAGKRFVHNIVDRCSWWRIFIIS